MARAKRREPFGPWSLVQIAAEAGITHRTARTLVANNVLNAHRLGYKDVLVARVAAALLDAPRPAGLNRTEAAAATEDRDREVLNHARHIMDDPTPDRGVLLAIAPDGVRLITNPMQAMGVLGDMGSQPLLLLPLGEWASNLRNTILSPAEAS